MFQQVILIGHIGNKKPGSTASQVPACQYSLATKKSVKKQGTDEWTEYTEWHRLVSYNKCAQHVINKIEPGDVVKIEGELRSRKYQDRNGIDRYITEIVVHDFPLKLPRYWKRDGQSASIPSQQPSPQAPQQAPANSPDNGFDSFDIDIPF